MGEFVDTTYGFKCIVIVAGHSFLMVSPYFSCMFSPFLIFVKTPFQHEKYPHIVKNM